MKRTDQLNLKFKGLEGGVVRRMIRMIFNDHSINPWYCATELLASSSCDEDFRFNTK